MSKSYLKRDEVNKNLNRQYSGNRKTASAIAEYTNGKNVSVHGNAFGTGAKKTNYSER